MTFARSLPLIPLLAWPCAAAAAPGEETPTPTPEASPAPAFVVDEEVVEIIDRATRRESPVAFSNLSHETLEEEGSFKDIPALLSELPSTLWFSENGNGIGYNYLTIRGFDQRRISVMVDGVPQNDPEDHNVYWVNFFDLSGSLEDVQVQRGGGAFFYGPPAIGGAVNMVTRRFPDEAYGALQLAAGVYDPAKGTGFGLAGMRATAEVGTGRIGAGALEDKVTVVARLSHLRSPGYRGWSWSRFWRAYLGAEVTGSRQILRLQAYGGPQHDALAYYGISKADNQDPELRRGNVLSGVDVELFNQTHYDAIHTFTPNERVVVTNTLFYLRGHGYFDFGGGWGTPDYFRLDEGLPPELAALYDPPEGDPDGEPAETIPEDTLIRAWVGNDQVGWLPRVVIAHPHGEHVVGAELRAHRSLHWGRIQGGDFPDEVSEAVVGDGGDYHYYSYRGAKDVASLYLGERAHLGAWAIHANLQGVAQRYRIYDEAFVGTELTVPYAFLNPRLGVNYNVTEALNVYAGVSRTRREPRLKEIYEAESSSWGVTPALGGDGQGGQRPLVGPETLIDYEAGLGLEEGDVRARLGAFFMDFQDEIVPSGGVDIFGQPRTANADKSVHLGLEGEGAVDLGHGFEVAAHGTVSRNRFESLRGALGGEGLAAQGRSAFTEYCEDPSGAIVAQDRTGNAIAGFPDLMGGLRVGYRREGLRVAVDSRYVGRFYTDNSQDTWCGGAPAGGEKVVDAYLVSSLSAGYAIPRLGLDIALDVSNLTNGYAFIRGEDGSLAEVSPYVALSGIEAEVFSLATRSTFLTVTKRW